MQKRYDKSLWLRSMLMFFIFTVQLLVLGCHNINKAEGKNYKNNADVQPVSNQAYVKFQSFQNPDSTWGFTIFVNSRPFLHYKKIPVSVSTTGFETKKDADKIADLFVMMIRKGNSTPKLDIKTFDTLGIIIRNRKISGF